MDEELRMKHINDLPAENLGQILRAGLTVIDRLHCLRVSRHWKWAVGDQAWTDLRKLDREIAFEGATKRQKERFTAEHLISLLHSVSGPKNSLVELDLHSFALHRSHQPFILGIAESLQPFTKLVKLDIIGFNLTDFVDFLPQTLRTLSTSGNLSLRTLKRLSVKCPNLEDVPFSRVDGINLDIVNRLIGKFPRQNTLNLREGNFIRTLSRTGGLDATAIGGLKELEVLELWDAGSLGEKALKAMVAGCQALRKFSLFDTYPLGSGSLSPLANLTNLTVLDLWKDKSGALTDSTLKAIAKRGQLKRLKARGSPLTDDSIVFLLDRCKKLVSLDLSICRSITERSLKAVIAEVNRRDWLSSPPFHLTGFHDPRVFFFGCSWTEISMSKARDMTDGNPWIALCCTDPRAII